MITSNSYHALEDRMRLDRRRLEKAHLTFALMNLYQWYANDLRHIPLQTDDLDRMIMDIIPAYHLAFCRLYTGM